MPRPTFERGKHGRVGALRSPPAIRKPTPIHRRQWKVGTRTLAMDDEQAGRGSIGVPSSLVLSEFGDLERMIEPLHKCEYCNKESALPCRNTRDMEQRAIEGSGNCYEALKHLGGGERGMEYIDGLRRSRKGINKHKPVPVIYRLSVKRKYGKTTHKIERVQCEPGDDS